MSGEWHRMSALALGAGIEGGAIDPRALTEYFLERIEEVDGDHAIYLRITAARARAEAEAAHRRAQTGLGQSPLDGVPISWKDLYDSAGDVTSHGTPALADRVATGDAKVLARATRAGLVCLGKTNQTEFAFSILGLNPKMGTPPNPFDEAVARIPGGSSSGAAVSVSRGLAAAAIGSDTGGSVRVPAAWNGLVGLKTSFGLLPLEGVLGLSTSMDTVGPLTRDVADSAALFAVLDGRFGAGNRSAPDLAGSALSRARPRGFRSLPRPFRAAHHARVGLPRSRRGIACPQRGQAPACGRLRHRRDAGARVRYGRGAGQPLRRVSRRRVPRALVRRHRGAA